MLGVSSPSTGSLELRKLAHGVAVAGEAPDLHTFPKGFLERELNDAIRVWVVVPSEPPVYYEVTAIHDGDLVGHRYEYVTPEKPKRKWWQRV